MNIKLSTILENVENLKNLQEVKMPIKVSYRIKRLVDKLSPILKTYEENRIALIKEYGEAQEDENFSVKDPEKLKIFMEKINELQSIEEEIDFELIKIEELNDVVIAPNQLPTFIFSE